MQLNFGELSSSPMFLTPFLCGCVFIFLGLIFLKYPPKNINLLYGYRTSRSMQSKEHWDYAQKKSSVVMIGVGIFMVICSFLSIPLNVKVGYAIFISVGFIIFCSAFLVWLTERAMIRKFEK